MNKFIESKAILKGHFVLSSGLHSDTYMQCARIFMNPKIAEKLCCDLMLKVQSRFGSDFADIIVAPALGGVVIGYEMGKQLQLNTVFCERVNNQFEFRRGFEIPENARVLVVEDVITTGKSSLETFAAIQKANGKVVAECCLVDRSSENLEEILGVPVVSLIKINVETFREEDVPDYLKMVPITRPGSRFISKI